MNRISVETRVTQSAVDDAYERGKEAGRTEMVKKITEMFKFSDDCGEIIVMRKPTMREWKKFLGKIGIPETTPSNDAIGHTPIGQ